MKFDAGLASDIVARALKLGADQAEVFFRSWKNISVEVKDRSVESFSSSFSSGYSVRIIRDSRAGFAFSTDGQDTDLVIRQALDAARAADPDPFLCLAQPLPQAEVNVCDETVRSLGVDTAKELTMEIERAAFAADARIKRLRKPLSSFTLSETIITNSNGINARYETTSCAAQVTAVAEENGESQTGWDYMGSRFLKDLSFDQVGRTAAASAVRLLGSRKISGMKTDIILDRSVAVDFLGVFASSLSSDAVQKSKSLLSNRLGSAVVSKGINIIDSGLLEGKTGSRPLDDEGVPTRTKQLVENGVLLSYLFNTYTARKGNAVSTGNAVRGSFSSLPSVGITNLYLEPSSSAIRVSAGKLFAALGKGLYILEAMGVHTINRISGDFSIGVNGLWIEDGEIAFPVREALISGNLLDLFGKVAAISDDTRFYANIGSPSLVISGIDVSA